MRWFIRPLFVFLLVLVGVPVYADPPFDSYFSHYVQRAHRIDKPVFYSQCSLREGSSIYKATVIFQVGESNGLFLFSEDHSIVNLTTLKWDGKHWKIGDLLGGVYTINKMYSLIEERLKEQYKIISASQLNQIFQMQPSEVCEHK